MEKYAANRGIRNLDRHLESSGAIAKLRSLYNSQNQLQHYGHQLVRCSSSAGASYSEARSATTPREFEHKLHECAKELRESLSWLNYIAHATKQSLSELRDECDQLVAIMVASVQTVRKNGSERTRPNKRPKRTDPQ